MKPSVFGINDIMTANTNEFDVQNAQTPPPAYSNAAAPNAAVNSMSADEQVVPGQVEPGHKAAANPSHSTDRDELPDLGFIDHADKTARIACPIAGHPAFDQGAYYHPAGCCCYVNNRHTQDCDPCTFCCVPGTLACWSMTLCYQPCGCVGLKQFPWLGDCPFSWQRVTPAFEHKHPDLVKTTVRMVLVPQGHRSRLILEHKDALLQKEEVPMTLANHPGKAICKMYEQAKYWGSYSFIESTLGDADNAVRIKYDGNFIWIEGQELVFDVSFWKYQEGQPVNFVGAGPRGPAMAGGGRDWTVNTDGTISLKMYPNFVLGL